MSLTVVVRSINAINLFISLSMSADSLLMYFITSLRNFRCSFSDKATFVINNFLCVRTNIGEKTMS